MDTESVWMVARWEGECGGIKKYKQGATEQPYRCKVQHRNWSSQRTYTHDPWTPTMGGRLPEGVGVLGAREQRGRYQDNCDQWNIIKKIKPPFESEEISDHQWDSGKYDGAADGDWENCVRSPGASSEGDWGIIVLCTVFLVSCVFFSKCLCFP